jgi:hypothetical protein
MGWCSVGSSGEECDLMTCNDIHGDYREGDGPIGCLVLSLLEDPYARQVIRSAIYPPILRVRDHVLPDTPAGAVIVRHFNRHYEEAVTILRDEPDLLTEVVGFMTEATAFARAMSGEQTVVRPSPGASRRPETPSSYTAARVRPAMVDRFSQILDRFRAKCSAGIGLLYRQVPETIPSPSRANATRNSRGA